MITKGHEEIFKGDENVLDYGDIKIPQVEYFKYVQFIVCQLYFNKFVSLKTMALVETDKFLDVI